MGDTATMPSNRVRAPLQAVMAIMDNPHPLETLGDSGAYGPEGSISRYHNPDHYTRVRFIMQVQRCSINKTSIDGTAVTVPPKPLMTAYVTFRRVVRQSSQHEAEL